MYWTYNRAPYEKVPIDPRHLHLYANMPSIHPSQWRECPSCLNYIPYNIFMHAGVRCRPMLKSSSQTQLLLANKVNIELCSRRTTPHILLSSSQRYSKSILMRDDSRRVEVTPDGTAERKHILHVDEVFDHVHLNIDWFDILHHYGYTGKSFCTHNASLPTFGSLCNASLLFFGSKNSYLKFEIWN